MDNNKRKEYESEYRNNVRKKLFEHQQLIKEVTELKERVAMLEAKVSYQDTIIEDLANRLIDIEMK